MPRFTLHLLVVLFISSIFHAAFAQTLCSGGTAGAYPCNNVDLYSYTNLNSSNLNASLANDIWGWTAPDGTEYAIIGLNNGTSFVDITDATAPVIIGKLPTHSGNSTWRDIKVVNDHAYIGSEASNHGVQVFDLNRLETAVGFPVTFTEDAHINNGKTHNIVGNDDTDFVYSVGGSQNSGGLTFFDVSDPDNPVAAGGYGSVGYSHDAHCFIYRGTDSDYIGAEICIGFNENEVVIVDVTDKSDPTTVALFDYPGNFYCHQGWITDDQKYLLVNDELDEVNANVNTTTFIFDISDLDNPTPKYTYVAASNSIDHNMYVKGPYMYQSNYTSGMRILDLSDLDNNMPTEVGYFDNHPQSNAAIFDGTWSVYPYFKSGKIVMTNIESTHGGLHILESTLPHYVLEPATTGIETICQGEEATFTFNTTSYAGFSDPDNITISNVPNGAIATLSANPVNTDGSFTLSVQTSAAITTGKYNIILTGTETPVNRTSVGLIVEAGNGGLSSSIVTSPANNASSMPINLTFTWNPVSGATRYDLDIATDNTFSNIVFNAYDLTSTSHSIFGLDYATTYFWRITSKDNNCATSPAWATRNFTTVDIPVPVELVDFSGSLLEKDISLDWQTASELGSRGFELQRAEQHDKLDFKKIAWVDSYPGNTSSLQAYNYLDRNVLPGSTYYYRLKLVDLDDTEEFSNIISLETKGKNPTLQVFPNPAKEHLSIFFDQLASSEKTTIIIYDVTGRQVISTVVNSNELSNGYRLNISDLTPGTYMLALNNNKVQETMRFVMLEE